MMRVTPGIPRSRQRRQTGGCPTPHDRPTVGSSRAAALLACQAGQPGRCCPPAPLTASVWDGAHLQVSSWVQRPEPAGEASRRLFLDRNLTSSQKRTTERSRRTLPLAALERGGNPLPGVVLSDVEGPCPHRIAARCSPHTGVIPSAVEGSCSSPRWYGVASPYRCRPERSRGTSRPHPTRNEVASPYRCRPELVEGPRATRQRGTLPAPERGRRPRSNAAGERDPSTSLRMTPGGGR